MTIPLWLFPRTRSFWYGIKLPLEAFRLLIRSPSLIIWSLIPLVITLALYIYLIQGLQSWAELNLHHLMSSWGWKQEGWISWTLVLLSRVLIFIASALTFSIVASLTASPFNDFLAEATEKFATPPLPPVSHQAWTLKIRLMWIDMGKTLAAAVASIVAIFVSWIPILNLVAMTCAFLLMTFQYISYPQTRRGLGINQGLLFLWRHLYACAGFGATLSLLFAIPLLSIFVMPLAVIGGTLLVARAPGLVEAQGPKASRLNALR